MKRVFSAMRFMRFGFLLLLLAAPVLVHAQANAVVYLQFGSFESRGEAEEKLTQVTKDHAGILGALPVAIREVAIAEDLTVYRTQAGPVSSRGVAQSMCGQLASNGDACYIVETAIQQALSTEPAPTEPVAEPPTPEAQKPVGEEHMQAVNKQAVEKEVQQIALRGTGLKPDIQPQMPEAEQALPDALEPLPDALQETAHQQQAGTQAYRDASNLKILQQVTGNTPEPPNAPLQQASQQVSSEMEAALAEAANHAPEAGKAPSFQDEKDQSFWDAINPFDDDTQASSSQKAQAQPAPIALSEAAASSENAPPVAPAAPRATPSFPMPEDSPSFRKAFAEPVTEERNEEPAIAAVPVEEVVETQAGAPFAIPTPTAEEERHALPRASIEDIINDNLPSSGAVPALPVDSGLPLPAPPLPPHIARQLNQSAPASLGVPVNEQERLMAEAPPEVPVNLLHESHVKPAIPALPKPRVVMPPVPSQSTTTVTAVLPDGGAVQVEEAQRVPLSEMEHPMAVPEQEEEPRRPVVAYSGPSNVRESALPSYSRLRKTIWAQLNYFETPQQALEFWDGFRRSHPDFPVVRVRVTKPYSPIPSITSQFSLRIGPFANVQFIENLCDSDPVYDKDLECRSMGDLGMSTNHQTRLGSALGRYGNQVKGMEALSGFWVQLGAFPSMGRAEKRWEDMKKEYGMVLSNMQARVSTPSLGSQARAVYRLRAGPFVNLKAAEELCGRLQQEQASCLVVAENTSH